MGIALLLLDAVYNEPNEITRQSFEDAKTGKTEGSIDTSSVHTMLKSIGLCGADDEQEKR